MRFLLVILIGVGLTVSSHAQVAKHGGEKPIPFTWQDHQDFFQAGSYLSWSPGWGSHARVTYTKVDYIERDGQQVVIDRYERIDVIPNWVAGLDTETLKLVENNTGREATWNETSQLLILPPSDDIGIQVWFSEDEMLGLSSDDRRFGSLRAFNIQVQGAPRDYTDAYGPSAVRCWYTDYQDWQVACVTVDRGRESNIRYYRRDPGARV